MLRKEGACGGTMGSPALGTPEGTGPSPFLSGALYARGLEEGADGLAVDAKSDDAGCPVDRVDRVGGDEPSRGEKAPFHGQRVGLVGRGSVHRALDAPHELPVSVCDEEAGGGGQIDRERAHCLLRYSRSIRKKPASQ